MELINNEANCLSINKEKRRTNRTWEAIQKNKGIWSYSNPKWISLREELLEERKR